MIESIAQYLLPVASWILFASLKSLAIIPLVLLIRRLFARWLTQQGRYSLWFAVIACMSIPFGAQVSMNNELPAAVSIPSAVTAPSATTRHEQPVISIVDARSAPTSDLPLVSKVILLWLAGIMALAIAVLHNANRYRRVKSRASDVDMPTDELFNSCKQLLKIRRRVRLLETSQVDSPIVVGYWRPTLLLPLNPSTRISNEQLRLVLLHELTHVRRHDILANWLISIVQIAHWFNPLAWYALRIMRNDMEQACDASVLRHLSASERIEYGDTLIRLADFRPQRTLLVQNASVVESRSQLKARINMIAQFRSGSTVSSMLGAALIALTASVAVIQAADAPQQPVRSAPLATPERAASPSKPGADAGKTTKPPAATAEKKAGSAPRLHSELLQINHADARELASFIRSAPGIGFLSDEGRIVADDKTNAIFVLDTARNISAIRQLVTRLDVPVQKVLIEAVVALIDSDLAHELTGVTVPVGSSSPVIAMAPGQTLHAVLEAAQKAHRAEIISAPVMIAANRARALFEQTGVAPGNSELKLAFTPTVWPDRRMQLDFDISVTSIITPPGAAATPDKPLPPAINTRQVKTQIALESGNTVMLLAGDGPQPRLLVVFATPKLIPKPAR